MAPASDLAAPPMSYSPQYRQQPNLVGGRPTLAPTTSPSATKPYTPSEVRRPSRSDRDSVISSPKSPSLSHAPSRNSVASIPAAHVRGDSIANPFEVDDRSASRATSRLQTNGEAEKYPPSVSAASTPRSTSRQVHRSNIPYDEDDEVDGEAANDHVLRILLYLSGPCTLLSFVLCFWTLLSLLIVILLQPLRLFSKARPTFSEHTKYFLGSPLKMQLHNVYTYPIYTNYNGAMLVMIHLLSPFVALGVGFMAWVAGCFWMFAAIIGDPGSKDGHNDGKESVLGVRAWWERWLCRALR